MRKKNKLDHVPVIKIPLNVQAMLDRTEQSLVVGMNSVLSAIVVEEINSQRDQVKNSVIYYCV